MIEILEKWSCFQFDRHDQSGSIGYRFTQILMREKFIIMILMV